MAATQTLAAVRVRLLVRSCPSLSFITAALIVTAGEGQESGLRRRRANTEIVVTDASDDSGNCQPSTRVGSTAITYGESVHADDGQQGDEGVAEPAPAPAPARREQFGDGARLFLATVRSCSSLRPFRPRFATVTPLRPVKHAMLPYLLAMVVSLVCVVLVRCLQSLAQLLEK